MSTSTPLPAAELLASGTSYDIGYQIGRQSAEEIERFLADGLARVQLLRSRPLAAHTLSRLLSEFGRHIEHDLPEAAAEVAGLADGAGIPYEHAVLLQCRRELIRHEDASDCTSILSRDAHGVWQISQTVDLVGGMRDLARVARVHQENPYPPRACIFTFVGLCGYAGINSAGLAAGITMVTSRGWRPGVPPYLILRHLLRCHSIDEALEEIRRIRRASSRYFALCEPHRSVAVEMTVDDLRVTEVTDVFVHTNHFVHPEFAGHETLTGERLEYSQRRRSRAFRLLAQGAPIESALGDHEHYPRSICAHNNGDMLTVESVAALKLQPANLSMQVAFGPPCQSAFVSYFS